MTEIEQRDLGKLVCHASLLVRRCLDNAIARATADYGDTLSGRNIWVLCYIRDHSDRDVFQKDLENAFHIRRSTVSQTVDLMEQKRLLERRPVNGDGRLKKLCLTPIGEGALLAAEQAMKEFYWIRSLRDIRKKPSTSELIDWLHALILGGITAEEISEKMPYLGILLKKDEDLTIFKKRRADV